MKLLDQLQMFFYTNLITNKTKKYCTCQCT